MLCHKAYSEIATQQQAPKARAEPPDFNNFTIFVLRPIATMAIVIKYLEIVLKILKMKRRTKNVHSLR